MYNIPETFRDIIKEKLGTWTFYVKWYGITMILKTKYKKGQCIKWCIRNPHVCGNT